MNKTLLLLQAARNTSNEAIIQNKKNIASFRATLKQDLKSLDLYKRLREEGFQKLVAKFKSNLSTTEVQRLCMPCPAR